jgi:S-adenosyl-L-methionine hydrolase (adenosine-forming)
MARPVIALLTDFGSRDHYAGVMKGVALGICPDVTLVDITHDIQAHDVLGGALELAGAYRYFPKGTIFLVVVDPGVGSTRRGMGADIGDYRFIAPDNGVLSAVFQESPPKRVVELTERRYARPTVSRTFEGRDRFAPAAAWLAKGIELSALGRPLHDYQRLTLPAPVFEDSAEEGRGVLRGTVVRVDRFGNLVTNVDRKTFEKVAASGSLHITIGEAAIPKVVGTYAEATPGEPCALFGSTDHLEIALNGASAAERLGAARGSDVRVSILRR